MHTTHVCDKCGKETLLYCRKYEFCYFCCSKNYAPSNKCVVKKCPICNKTFATNIRLLKYCSDKCKKMATPVPLHKFMNIQIRDNFTCQMCGKKIPKTNTPHRLHVHHIIPGGPDTPNNLICLCTACHARVHRFPKKHKKFIKT